MLMFWGETWVCSSCIEANFLYFSPKYREPEIMTNKGHGIVYTLHGLVLTGMGAQQIMLTRACPQSITSWLVTKRRFLGRFLVMEEYWRVKGEVSQQTGALCRTVPRLVITANVHGSSKKQGSSWRRSPLLKVWSLGNGNGHQAFHLSLIPIRIFTPALSKSPALRHQADLLHYSKDEHTGGAGRMEKLQESKRRCARYLTGDSPTVKSHRSFPASISPA